MHKLKIILPGDTFGASIEMDGKQMKGVSKINLSVVANQLVQVNLTMYAQVEIEGELKDTEIVHLERGVEYLPLAAPNTTHT